MRSSPQNVTACLGQTLLCVQGSWGDPPLLRGQHDWAWIIAGTYRLVFRGRSNFDHCPLCTTASFDAKQAAWQCRATHPPAAAPSPRAHRAFALQSAVNVLPRAASLSSAKGATATSLDYYGEDEEDGSFQQFHVWQVQLGSPRKEGEAPLHWVVHNSPSAGDKIDPLWQTTRWLRSFREQCKKDEPIWWSLIHPLTDGRDMAALDLAQWLMATWRWEITISTPPICPPAPTVMNIGQFLDKDTTGQG